MTWTRRSEAVRQRGAALLIFMLVSFLAATSWFLSQASSVQWRNQADRTTVEALALAKSALVGRAAADNNRPGSLPCPDVDNDGVSDGNFGFCTSAIGRLPVRTLDLPDLLDGEGNRLWYTLADELRDNDDAAAINPTLVLGLSIDGTDNIAAIIFSPGTPLSGQDGRPSDNIGDYLDGENKDGSPYVSGPASPNFNDTTFAISRDQLFRVVNRRVLGQLGADLEKYYLANANLYPESGTDMKTALEALALASEPAEKPVLEKKIEMLDRNGWFAITNYMPAPDRKSATLAIAVPPAITCTIAPAKKPVCMQP